MNEVRVGIVGIGNRRPTHLKVFENIGVARVVGVFDVNSVRARRVSRRWNVKAYSSYEELLADPQIEGVVIATVSP